MAIDDSSCTIVTVPKVEGRHYTVHFLNSWGETIANINERLFPKRPFGEFAMCLRGANAAIPAGATRIDLPVKYSRVLARIELGADPETAIALQHQFKFRATGSPKLPEIPKTPIFELNALAIEAAPFVVRVKLDDATFAQSLPAGSSGTAAIYTEHVKATHIIRRVILRQIAILNYVNPF